MNEFIAVDFVFSPAECMEGYIRIRDLGDDFVSLGSCIEDADIEDMGSLYSIQVQRITGKIRSSVANFLVLSDDWLATRMNTSSIPDELKDKYRR